MPQLQLNDTFLDYELVGQGPACLVMHGGLGLDRFHMRGHDVLADRLTLAYYDHRGNGRSGRPPVASLTWDALCADAAALARAVSGAEPVGLIGNSYGGQIALEFARRYPQAVRFMILTGTAAHFGDPGALVGRAAAAGAGAAELAVFTEPSADSAELMAKFSRLLPFYFFDRSAARTQWFIEGTLGELAALGRSFEILPQYDVRPALHDIRVPVFVGAGAHDWVTPTADQEWMAEHLPNATFVRFEKSGHFPFLEEPAAFAAAVGAWLATV